VTRIGVGLAATARTLLFGFFPSGLSRLVMANYATGSGADNAMMPRKVPCDASHCRALQAASSLRRSHNPASYREKGKGCRQ